MSSFCFREQPLLGQLHLDPVGRSPLYKKVHTLLSETRSHTDDIGWSRSTFARGFGPFPVNRPYWVRGLHRALCCGGQTMPAIIPLQCPPARRVQQLHYLWVYVKCLVYLSECPSAATGNCRSKVWSTRNSIRGFIKRELLIFTLTVCRSDFVHSSRKMGPWHNEMRIGSPHTGKNTIHTIQYWSNDLDTQLTKSIQ